MDIILSPTIFFIPSGGIGPKRGTFIIKINLQNTHSDNTSKGEVAMYGWGGKGEGDGRTRKIISPLLFSVATASVPLVVRV